MKKGLLLLMIMAFGIGANAATASTKTRTLSSKAKKAMKNQREDLFESLEEKVFRAPNSDKARLAATDEALDVGKKRMYYLQREEDEIRTLENELGMEDVEHNFLCDKYNDVMEQFKDVKSEIDVLTLENKKLKSYLARINAMEAKVKGAAVK